jgi:hypothetical protein
MSRYCRYLEDIQVKNKHMKGHLTLEKSKLKGEWRGGDLTFVQYKPTWNCHNESPHIINIS